MTFKGNIYGSKLLCRLYCWYSRIRYPKFNKMLLERESKSLFDYQALRQPLPKHYKEICTDNNCFGIGFQLRKYSGYKRNYINAWIEHGFFWTCDAYPMAESSFAKVVLTFSNYRVNKYCNSSKKSYAIGPYIHYAEDYLSSTEFMELKSKLGRVLLVFPSHSASGTEVSFDYDELFSAVGSISKGFDTVIFSLFWSDINTMVVEKLKEKKYLIACAGHRYDHNFLSRQKSLIKLSDVTMSNSLGTHLAYCVYLGKPHWLFGQQISYKSTNAIGKANKEISHKYKDLNIQNREHIIRLFSKYSDDITAEQFSICNELFGFDQIKNEKEMCELLKSIE